MTEIITRAGIFGLCVKVLLAVGATGVASMRSCQSLAQCLIEPKPAGSKMDLLLARLSQTEME